MKKRIFAFSLVFMLCFVNVHQVYADAGSLVIGGSAIAGVGAGVIAGPAVVAVFCAMMAFGMNVELTEASQEAGMTKTEFLKSKIQQYCNEAQISANTFNNYILDQANVFQNGSISLTKQAGNLIEKFCNWLFASEQVENPSNGIGSSVTIDGVACPVITNGMSGHVCDVLGASSMYFYIEGNYPLALFCMTYPDNGFEVYCISKDARAFENLSVKTQFILNGQDYTQYNGNVSEYNGVYCTCIQRSWARDITNITIPNFIASSGQGLVDLCNTITDLDLGSPTTVTDKVTGDQVEYDTSKHVLNPSDTETIVINPNITIPVPVDKDVTIDVNEYIDVIQDLIDGVTDDIITAIDDATGVPIVIEWDPTQDWDPTIEKEDDTELPDDEDKTPVVDDDTIPSDFNVDPLKFDLKGFFPFCLPFDVADMIGMLQADPVAPSYTVDWDLPFIEQNLTFTVDLEPYDNVAETCRKMEILLFCVGLAVVTRSIFIRS